MTDFQIFEKRTIDRVMRGSRGPAHWSGCTDHLITGLATLSVVGLLGAFMPEMLALLLAGSAALALGYQKP